MSPEPRGYKTFFMLNSTEHEIYMLANVGILTFLSLINTPCCEFERNKCLCFSAV